VKVATKVLGLYAMVPTTAAEVFVFFTVMFVVFIVVWSIASLKVNCTVAFVAILVEPLVGTTLTVGGVVSRVLNVHMTAAAIGVPKVSFTPVTVTVYAV
jgi:hypothetical protein